MGWSGGRIRASSASIRGRAGFGLGCSWSGWRCSCRSIWGGIWWRSEWRRRRWASRYLRLPYGFLTSSCERTLTCAHILSGDDGRGDVRGADPPLRSGISVGAGDAFVSGEEEGGGAAFGSADAVSARPGPDRPLEGVQAPEAQDAGVHRAGGRSLPDAAHAYARDGVHRADRVEGAGVERGLDGGDRAWA